ncbi:hypothetical protein FB567DRAFT_521560 [Paraphoma chrysanthemicola]|uniref:Tachykinin family protein n=1 Tax=Paraphoma chrysanthemicola TaxID=798071 RepID=A0A8K0RCP9_9PLEO|nr:hypothetical protein FB567DRAFT_521560 [Paraphoma chrysanthemicola]
MTALRFRLSPTQLMASDNTGRDKAPRSNPTPGIKPKRQRKKKRDGPPQFQFLTVTDPGQFKDGPAKRTVRSQAMIHTKHIEHIESERKGKQASEPAAAPAAAVPHAPSVVRGRSLEGSLANPVPPFFQRHELDPGHLRSTTWGAEPSLQIWGATNHAQHMSVLDNDLRPNMSATGARDTKTCKVVNYEQTDRHEEAVTRMLVGKLARYHQIGDGIDPFVVLPQFDNPELSALYLTRQCMRAFASDSTVKKWLPAMLSHPHILLSSTILVSTWLDMRAGCSGDSSRTAMVKAETLRMIHERITNPTTELNDSTLMVILHLLAGEMWSCNEENLRTHEAAVARFITSRGGLRSLENRAVVEVAAACCYHCDIFCEVPTLPLFHAWEPPDFVYLDDDAALPESPLFSPRSDFHTIANDASCSVHTLGILYDMRQLTDVFIAHNAGLGSVYDVEVDSPGRSSPPKVDLEARVSIIHQRLLSLPTAYQPGHASSEDWVYETCRIAALIYTTAIIMRVPFSVAADLSHHQYIPIEAESSATADIGYLPTTRPTEALYEALGRTDVANLWNNMSGVLYWVCLVGAAASRSPATMDMTAKIRLHDDAHAVWIRRCLIMVSTRTMIVLVFQHPQPVLIAQRRLLKVQELITIGPAREAI